MKIRRIETTDDYHWQPLIPPIKEDEIVVVTSRDDRGEIICINIWGRLDYVHIVETLPNFELITKHITKLTHKKNKLIKSMNKEIEALPKHEPYYKEDEGWTIFEDMGSGNDFNLFTTLMAL